jgi:hypothetical protein
MFKCCYNIDVIEPTKNVIPILNNKPKLLSSNKPQLLSGNNSEPVKKPFIFKSDSLNNDGPTSPDLTNAEIEKIHKNIDVLKRYNEKLFNLQGHIITDVWSNLSDLSLSEGTATKNQLITNWLTSIGTIIAIAGLATAPLGVGVGLAILSVIIGAVTTFIVNNNTDNCIGRSISSSIGTLTSQNIDYYELMMIMFDHCKDHTNENRDTTFTFCNITHTLRDLLTEDIKEGTAFDNHLILAGRLFKQKIALPILINEQILDLYFIMDSQNSNADFGHCFQPAGVPGYTGKERTCYYDASSIGDKVRIICNDEVLHYQADRYPRVEGYGSSNSDLIGSYTGAIQNFVKDFRCALVGPWTITDKVVYSLRWYIVLGRPKLKDNANMPFYTLAGNDFLNWLFIDDGVGNILNTNGILFRYDALRSKNLDCAKDLPNLFLHSDQFGDSNNVSDDYKTLTSWSDYYYGPKDSSELNKQYHVYVGDISQLN